MAAKLLSLFVVLVVAGLQVVQAAPLNIDQPRGVSTRSLASKLGPDVITGVVGPLIQDLGPQVVSSALNHTVKRDVHSNLDQRQAAASLKTSSVASQLLPDVTKGIIEPLIQDGVPKVVGALNLTVKRDVHSNLDQRQADASLKTSSVASQLLPDVTKGIIEPLIQDGVPKVVGALNLTVKRDVHSNLEQRQDALLKASKPSSSSLVPNLITGVVGPLIQDLGPQVVSSALNATGH